MQTILITGGTGYIGTALSQALVKKGYKVIILTRQPSVGSRQSAIDGLQSTNDLKYANWDIENQRIDENAIAEADHIIHLAGANVGEKRWTEKRKKEIVESRTHSSQLLVKSLKEISNKVQTVVSAAGIGWYGPDPEIPNPKPFIEKDDFFDDFLGHTCKQWEESIQPVTSLGKRLVILRTGMAISKESEVIKRFKKPLRLGTATILGSGRQIISWIHLDDLVRMYIAAIENKNLEGPYNAVAPFPVTNKTFVMRLAREVKGKFFIPVYVPSFVLKLVLGEMSIEVLKSATVSCEKIKKTGFTFLYPSITPAIQNSIEA